MYMPESYSSTYLMSKGKYDTTDRLDILVSQDLPVNCSLTVDDWEQTVSTFLNNTQIYIFVLQILS